MCEALRFEQALNLSDISILYSVAIILDTYCQPRANARWLSRPPASSSSLLSIRRWAFFSPLVPHHLSEHKYGTILLRVLDRVAQDVEEGPLQAFSIHGDHGILGLIEALELCIDFYAIILYILLHQFYNIFYRFLRIKLLPFFQIMRRVRRDQYQVLQVNDVGALEVDAAQGVERGRSRGGQPLEDLVEVVDLPGVYTFLFGLTI